MSSKPMGLKASQPNGPFSLMDKGCNSPTLMRLINIKNMSKAASVDITSSNTQKKQLKNVMQFVVQCQIA
jgi:hypothetical protein